jgi:hypothetical protein
MVLDGPRLHKTRIFFVRKLACFVGLAPSAVQP